MAAHAELAAGDADDHLVLHRQHGRGVGLALGRVAVDRRPLHLAGHRVERHHGGVGLVQEDGVVGVGEAAVDGVAAHHRDHVRVLLRLVAPDDLAVLAEVERKDVVRERRVHVHHVADDERRTLVPAQDAGREGPGHLQVADVLGVDLVELRVAGVGVVAGLDRVVRRVADRLDHAVVGERRNARRRQQRRHAWQETFHGHAPPTVEPRMPSGPPRPGAQGARPRRVTARPIFPRRRHAFHEETIRTDPPPRDNCQKVVKPAPPRAAPAPLAENPFPPSACAPQPPSRPSPRRGTMPRRKKRNCQSQRNAPRSGGNPRMPEMREMREGPARDRIMPTRGEGTDDAGIQSPLAASSPPPSPPGRSRPARALRKTPTKV